MPRNKIKNPPMPSIRLYLVNIENSYTAIKIDNIKVKKGAAVNQIFLRNRTLAGMLNAKVALSIEYKNKKE